MKGLLSLSLLPLLSVASPILVDSIHNEAAPILSTTNAKEIPDNYIVVFKKHVDQLSAVAHHSWVQDLHVQTENTKTELRKRSSFSLEETFFGGLKHTYNIAGGLVGYSGHFDEDVIEAVRRHPDVSSFPSLSLSVTLSLALQRPRIQLARVARSFSASSSDQAQGPPPVIPSLRLTPTGSSARHPSPGTTDSTMTQPLACYPIVSLHPSIQHLITPP